jgi:hypothetical protein
VVTRSQLTGVFVGSTAISEGFLTRRQLRERSYRRLVHGVYADPGLPLDHRLRCTGVALLLPRGTAIGGHSAAAWHGAPFARTLDPVTVLRRPDVLWKGPRGVRVHRTDFSHSDVEDQEGVPVSSAMRTAWDLAALEPLPTAVAALDAMVRAGTVTASALAAMAASGTGRWGVSKVRTAVPMADPRAESPPESWVRVALVLAGLAPVPQVEVYDSGGFVARVDLAFPDAKLAIEYDGEYHFTEEQVLTDDARIQGLESAGWRVIRLRAADLRDLRAIVDRVRAALNQ